MITKTSRGNPRPVLKKVSRIIENGTRDSVNGCKVKFPDRREEDLVGPQPDRPNR